MKRPDRINIEDYNYPLPDSAIARFPLTERDQSKLLVCERGAISHHQFQELPEILSPGSLLVFNETKVIRARIIASKESGARIEIFLLDPVLPFQDMQQALGALHSTVWKCMIGNKKKFREEDVLKIKTGKLTVEFSWKDREQDLISIEWNSGEFHFGQVLEQIGRMPIPPYLQRDPELIDNTVYQTVYSRNEGSVAAPTAGLHFTPEIFEKLGKNNIQKEFITLHVGAGTFKPVKTENALDHSMHAEHVFFTRSTILQLIKNENGIIPVGTTSLRSLESLYWFGAGLLKGDLNEFRIEQEYAYHYNHPHPSRKDSLERAIRYMDERHIDFLSGSTAIYMVPGYDFKIPKALITNFHQPGSTLILLIAALIGNSWKEVYETALLKNYRFLSYGDSCLLIP